MDSYTERKGLQIEETLARFVESEAVAGTGVAAEQVWDGLAALVSEFGERNRDALKERARIHQQIDAWHVKNRETGIDPEAYQAFLREIGYLVPEPASFSVETTRIDPEFSSIAGPQLVVPITNARYALNAANARWGSLYDALYGTDALGSLPERAGYDAERGRQVIRWAKKHLDRVVPLVAGRWKEVTGFTFDGAILGLKHAAGMTALDDPSAFAGTVTGDDGALRELILKVHGLHIRIVIDPTTEVGATDPAGISDVLLEAAISTIMDMEDSVACVDGPDKAQAYGNWLGLMKGDLTEEVSKGGRTFTRALAPDIAYTAPDGSPAVLKGRSLMLVRNVGHLMTTPAVLDAEGNEIGEGLLDALISVLIALHDLRREGGPVNSPAGSVYVVKPKMHGPVEVKLACDVFTKVEEILGLDRYTVKIGIMDEERRTSANLAACIEAARNRVCFINTGFLDRTGDETSTSMEAGPMVPKADMKNAAWLDAYEKRNVDIGLACGLKGRGQIGKGMWAAPDRMADMLEQKIGHPMAGATCAWVPSPTAAVLHSTHYHVVDVFHRLEEIEREIAANGPRAPLEALLTIPLLDRKLTDGEIEQEIENCCQGILGYVVRWVNDGVGCSKVPDINDVGLMEDRATCRISSQALVNWLHHGVVNEKQVMNAMRRMAEKVDGQNAADPGYRPMAPKFGSHAFQAACDLVFNDGNWPSGYTEPTLHYRRRQVKAKETRKAAEGADG
ncbi:malate synthase G [Tropicimonas sediminicola]|uniref:Malate synthase G n=1 Tax=Tropicimonas sediminicola TaxID=1031541 RepID=A0A239GVC0_9RHOB|nr:malate synthase G [Tropicimonas sediminicola]SNS72921.1 malate synthase [Tropicimonas sediminicola]